MKLEADIRTVAKNIIQGNEQRKRRIKNGDGSAFDLKAVRIIADALDATCRDISSGRARRQLQKKIYESILYRQPYEHMKDIYCGRRQFYSYRMEFICRVADALDMLPQRQGPEEGRR